MYCNGKGAYRFVSKTLAAYEDDPNDWHPLQLRKKKVLDLVNEVDIVGWIDCKKDTRIVTENLKTLRKLDKSLEYIVPKGKLTICKRNETSSSDTE